MGKTQSLDLTRGAILAMPLKLKWAASDALNSTYVPLDFHLCMIPKRSTNINFYHFRFFFHFIPSAFCLCYRSHLTQKHCFCLSRTIFSHLWHWCRQGIIVAYKIALALCAMIIFFNNVLNWCSNMWKSHQVSYFFFING